MATSSTAVGANEKPTALELIKPLVKALSITVGIETPRCVLVPATIVNVNSDAKAFGSPFVSPVGPRPRIPS